MKTRKLEITVIVIAVLIIALDLSCLLYTSDAADE